MWLPNLERLGRIVGLYKPPATTNGFWVEVDIKNYKPNPSKVVHTAVGVVFNMGHPDFDPAVLPRRARRRIIEFLREDTGA